LLKDSVLLQKRELELKLKEAFIERDAPVGRLSNDMINVIIGPRRAGKSFYAMKEVSMKESFGYLNFDDERIGAISEYDELLAAVETVYDHPKNLLLDEVQNIPKWELLINRLQRQGYDLIVTGSNAHLLGTELSTHLTGRHLQTVMFPFSFNEFLRTYPQPNTIDEKREALSSYCENGGYPEPIIKKVNRRDYLSTLFRSILYKDIVVRHGIRSPQAIEDLAVYLMSNTALEYSSNSLVKTLKLKSVNTVEKYIKHLEEAFLFFPVRRYSFKFREQLRSNRKIYCMDNGMATSVSFRTSPNRGRLFENLVAISLQRRKLSGELDYFFWKGERQEEVDFVIKQGLTIQQLIQVCFDTDNPKTREREIRALLKASEELKCNDMLILTDKNEGEEKVSWYGKKGVIRHLPLWKWLTA